MMEDRSLPPPLPPRLDWFVHTQMGQLVHRGIPEWFHGAISREAAENLLELEPPGSFLVRVSHSHVGYTLSYKALDCCRHFMVKLLDDGSFVIPGESTNHASLEALVSFHQQKPVHPYGELLTQPCGQQDPENVDYEDLFVYSNALAEDAVSLAHGPSASPVAATEKASPESAPLYQLKERKPAAEMDRASPEVPSACPSKVPHGDAHQKLWKNLKTFPKLSKRVQQQVKSHLATVSLPLLRDNKGIPATHSSRAKGSSQEDSGVVNRKDGVHTDPTEDAQTHRGSSKGRNPFFKAALRSLSWSGVTLGDRGQHQEVGRAPSLQVSKQETEDLAEPEEDWMPEEYRQPPPFAPGYW
ncbi:hematopoietic SH2 domain-containing protein [Rhynchocyon petersi]